MWRGESTWTAEIDATIRGLERVAIELDGDPDRPDYMMKLAKAYSEKKDYFNGLAASDEMQRDEYSKTARACAVRSFYVLEALISDPEYSAYKDLDEALHRYAIEAYDLGEEATAQIVYQRLINDFPNSPRVPAAYLMFADYYLDDGNFETAARLYERVIQTTRESKRAVSENEAKEFERRSTLALERLAEEYSKIEQWDESTKVYKSLQRLFEAGPDLCKWQRSIIENERMNGNEQQLKAEEDIYSKSARSAACNPRSRTACRHRAVHLRARWRSLAAPRR